MGAKLLTAASVQRVKADPSRRLEIPDRQQPGLYLVVQPSGRRGYAVRTRLNDKPIKLTLGDVDRIDLGKARLLAEEALRAARRGDDPRLVRAAAQANTVAAVVEEFIHRYAKPRLKVWAEVDRRLKRDLVRVYGTRPIAELTRTDLVRLLDELAARGVKQGANRLLAHTHRLLGWALERGYVTANVAAGIKPPAKEVARDRVLDDAEIAAVWQAAGALGFPFGPLFRTMIVTAQREGEVAGMRRTDLVLGGPAPRWVLPREATKADRRHEVPLSELACEILAGVPQIVGSQLVFSTTRETAPSGWSRAKQRLDLATATIRAERRLGRALAQGELPAECSGDEGVTDYVPPWRLHDLRRTAASSMARLGHAPHVVAAVLNHAPGALQGITAVYNRHRYEDEKRAALETWARHVGRVTESWATEVLALRLQE